MMFHTWGWGMGGLGWGAGLFMLLFWIALIVWGVRAITGHGRYGRMHMHNAGCCGPGGNALDIARERYARGEINKDQFEDIKKGLMS